MLHWDVPEVLVEQYEHCGVQSLFEWQQECLGVNDNGQALCTGSWDTLLKIWA